MYFAGELKAKKDPGQKGRRTGQKERLNWELKTQKGPTGWGGVFFTFLEETNRRFGDF